MLEIRPCRDEAEEELTLGIYNAVWPLDALTMTEVRAFKAGTLEYEDYIALEGGVALGGVALARLPSRPDLGWMMLTVSQDRRGRGVGSALLEAARGWLSERGFGEAEAQTPEDDDASLAWAARRGFLEVGRNGRLLLDLGGYDPPPVAPPAGVEITTLAERPGAERGLYEVACDAYLDIPGEEDYVMPSFEDWLAHDMGGPGDLPEATFLALAGGEVVGYAKFVLRDARPGTAEHDMTGVKRAWRGRGVAGALKRAQVAWAKENGYERLVTINEMRNEPIRRLNERLGYRPAPGRVLLRGPVSGAT